jgi:hypothetical protein
MYRSFTRVVDVLLVYVCVKDLFFYMNDLSSCFHNDELVNIQKETLFSRVSVKAFVFN